VYTLGIGSGVSQNLVNSCAKAGNGSASFVSDSSNISSKVIELLSKSMSKRFYDFRLIYDKDKVEFVVPDLSKVRYLRNNESLQLFVFLKKGFENT
jgi:hypothetical protein